MDNLLILGSARRQPNMQRLATKLLANSQHTILNLLDYSIAPYSYTYQYPETELFNNAIGLVLSHQALIFAMLIYLYAMSGQMKVFLDRFTDLLTVAKGKGHMLRRMRMLLIAVSNSPKLPQRFNIPFSATADYLGIQYRGTFFCPSSAMGRPIANQQ